MSGIDGVGGSQPPIEPEGSNGPEDIEDIDGVHEASQSVGDRLRETQGGDHLAPVPNAHDESLERMHSTIVAGLERAESRQEIMERVVETEVEAQFGSDASPEMSKLIQSTFEHSPKLQKLFDVLYTHAVQTFDGGKEF